MRFKSIPYNDPTLCYLYYYNYERNTTVAINPQTSRICITIVRVGFSYCVWPDRVVEPYECVTRRSAKTNKKMEQRL